MKIVIPILGFDRTGGYRVLSKLANEWIQQGHIVDFLCPDSSNEPYFPTSAGIIWVDGAGSVSEERKSIAATSSWYRIKSLYLGIKAIGNSYDVIFANHSFTAWPVSLAPNFRGKKIYYVQAYEPEYYLCSGTARGYLLALLSALTYHLPLYRIVNAPIYFRYKNLRADEFVPPGLDLEIFKPTKADKKLEEAKTVIIGCIGRHEPTKGIIFALHAFEKISRQDERFILKVAFGNLPQDWQHERCEIVNPKNDQELANYYRSLDILIAPGTVQHGAPHYPVLEAGACGIAVVTSGYMGATPETAWITRNKDVHSITQSILDVVSDDQSRIEKKLNFLKNIHQYSWPEVSKKMLLLFNKISKQ